MWLIEAFDVNKYTQNLGPTMPREQIIPSITTMGKPKVTWLAKFALSQQWPLFQPSLAVELKINSKCARVALGTIFRA